MSLPLTQMVSMFSVNIKKNGALASGRGDMHEREVKCFILKTKVGLVGGERSVGI